MKFSPGDLEQIRLKGLSIDQVEKQLEIFKKGLPAVHIMAAATAGNGIIKLTENDLEKLSEVFEDHKSGMDISKFVPASGQATRMFKFLFEYLENFNPYGEKNLDSLDSPRFSLVRDFNKKKNNLPFYSQLTEGMRQAGIRDTDDLYQVVKYMLDPEGLNLGGLPKGLIDFHLYGNEPRTAFEEHLHEALSYLKNKDILKLHFTVSEDHRSLFNSKLSEIRPGFEKLFGCRLEVTFSVQDPSTDTIAVKPDNSPFRDDSGQLVFRPSGHGALLLNLNAMEEDLVFLRNIDNVAREEINREISIYRKALAGLLIDKKNKAHELIEKLGKDTLDSHSLEALLESAYDELNIRPADNLRSMSDPDKIYWLKNELNRPIRICGMVKNEGQPGGGPFWVRGKDGSASLQIVELAQIDQDKPDQAEILAGATHFNPVDVVCWLTDPTGRPFDLLDYSDPDSAFISEKTHMGKPLKALEMPGLWNGGMANWITLFVEVPLMTFNPVKTVNDLLGPMHSKA